MGKKKGKTRNSLHFGAAGSLKLGENPSRRWRSSQTSWISRDNVSSLGMWSFFPQRELEKKKNNREKPQKWERIQLRALRNPWEEAGGNPLESPGERGPGIKGNVLPGILRGLTALACESEPDPGGKKKNKSHYPRKINRDFNKGKPRAIPPCVSHSRVKQSALKSMENSKKNPSKPFGIKETSPKGSSSVCFSREKKGAFQA